MNEKEERQEKATLLEPQTINIIIPECCRLGLESCKHVAKKYKKVKQNVGL